MNAPERVLPKTMNVYQKLQAARIKLQSIELKKSGNNKFAGYKYFELGDFLPTINKIFSEIGLCGMVTFGKEIAELLIVDTDNPNLPAITFTSPMSTAALKGCHEVQNLGAVQTYIRRYLWVAAMEIVEHDALDSSEPVKEPTTQDVEAAIQVLEVAADSGEEAFKKAIGQVSDAIKAKINPNVKKALVARSKEVKA